MTEGEKPLETTRLDALIVDAREVKNKMNDINDLYEFGHPAVTEGGDRTPVKQEERAGLEERWEALSDQLVKTCEDIYREQGGMAARNTVLGVVKNVHLHITGEMSENYRLRVVDTILTNITEK